MTGLDQEWRRRCWQMRHLAEDTGRTPVASSEASYLVGSRPWLVMRMGRRGPSIARREKSCYQHTHACPSVVLQH